MSRHSEAAERITQAEQDLQRAAVLYAHRTSDTPDEALKLNRAALAYARARAAQIDLNAQEERELEAGYGHEAE